MADLIMNLYDVGFFLWNTFIDYALTFLKTSPKDAADTDLVNVVKPVYDGLLNFALTLVVIFCLLAIIKDVVTASPGQQLQKLANSGLRYAVMIVVISHLWDLLNIIIDACDYVTTQAVVIDEAQTQMSFSDDAVTLMRTYFSSPPDFSLLDVAGSLAEWAVYIISFLLFIISALVFIFIVCASAVSIISASFQRIIKPVLIMPFSGIFVATGASTGDSSRAMWNFFKTFIGFCLCGALMVICIRLGSVLAGNLSIYTQSKFPSFDPSEPNFEMLVSAMFTMTIQMLITPLMISGLVKSVDSILSRIL